MTETYRSIIEGQFEERMPSEDLPFSGLPQAEKDQLIHRALDDYASSEGKDSIDIDSEIPESEIEETRNLLRLSVRLVLDSDHKLSQLEEPSK